MITSVGGDVRGDINYNPSAVRLTLTVAVVVFVAAAAGLFASPLLRAGGVAAGQQSGDTSSAELPFTHAVRQIQPLCGATWVTPKSPDQIRLPMPSGLSSWSQWSEVNAGGAQASPGQVEITIQGRSAAKVVLTDMKVRVVQRRGPLHGTAIDRECGDQGVVRWLAVNLDRDPVALVDQDEFDAMMPDTPQWERKPILFPYRVSLTDPETFVVKASTDGCDCDWVVDVYWSAQGQTGVLPIDDGGRPFRTTSTANAKTCAVLDTVLACR